MIKVIGKSQWLLTVTPRVIDREMISQSVLPTHHASIFPVKNTRVVKMAARIEAGASFSNWEEWNKTLANFKSSQIKLNLLYSAARALLLRNEGYRRRLCNTHMITNNVHSRLVWLHSFGQAEESKFRTATQSTEIASNHPTLISIWHQHPPLTGSPCQ